MPRTNGVSDYSTKHNKANETFVPGGDAREITHETTEGASDTTNQSSINVNAYEHTAMHEQPVDAV